MAARTSRREKLVAPLNQWLAALAKADAINDKPQPAGTINAAQFVEMHQGKLTVRAATYRLLKLWKAGLAERFEYQIRNSKGVNRAYAYKLK